MPFVKRQRKYYKYVDWSQPINPTDITATSGWGSPANAFDDVADTYATCGTSTDYIEWDLGANILLSGITATGYYVDSVSRAMGLRIYKVEDSVETLLGETNKASPATTYNLSATFTETLCSKLRIRLATSNAKGDAPTTTYPTRIREIKLTATQQVVESTSSDYDWYEDNHKFYQLISKGKQYFKNFYRVNTTITGSPTINNCVVSGFSSSNYLGFPAISIGNEPWEIVFKATTGSSTGNNQGLFGITGTGYTRCDTSNNKLRILLSNSSSSFNIGEIASRTLSANTTYWFKITFTGSSYNMYSSTDGINYTLDQSKSSTAKTTFASGMMIGRARDGVWGGSIDLKESYIKINDKVVWDNIYAGAGTSTDYDYYIEKLLAYSPIVRGKRIYYKQDLKQRDTGTYTFTLNKEYTAKMLFVGNGGGGCSSQKDSQWHYSGGGSGACFEGLVKLPADTYTLTIGSLGYGNNRDNVHYHSSTVVSTDSYLTNSAGQELIRVGAGGNGYTSVGGVSGAAGVLTMGTLNVLETNKAVNGNTQVGKTASTNYSLSAYDGTETGYGAGTGAERGEGNVYGIKGIFDLVLETDINDYTYYVDVATRIY